jgi:hypothetical protein
VQHGPGRCGYALHIGWRLLGKVCSEVYGFQRHCCVFLSTRYCNAFPQHLLFPFRSAGKHGPDRFGQTNHNRYTSSLPRIRRGLFLRTSDSPLLRTQVFKLPFTRPVERLSWRTRVQCSVSWTAESARTFAVSEADSVQVFVADCLFNARSNALGSMLCLPLNALHEPSAHECNVLFTLFITLAFVHWRRSSTRRHLFSGLLLL